MKQKSVVLTTLILGLVAGCAGSPAPGAPPEVTPNGQQPPAGAAAGNAGALIQLDAANIVTRDLGHKGGPSVSVNLYSPIEDALVTKGYKIQTAGACWALADIFLYQVTLKNAGTGEVLTTFDVNCKGGRAKAVLQHLKPGVKYSITIVAKGNKGGTAGDTVLNAKTPSVGYFDLTHVDPLLEGQEVTAAIQVELDCEGVGYYERSGKIDIIPVVKGGGQVTYQPESGQGECYVCGDYPIYAGTTTYDSMFHAGTNGDVFNTNPHHNHWTNEINGWGWVQRDFPYAYNVSEISIAEAFNDKSKAPLTELYVKLRNPQGEWVAVDTVLGQNISNYKKKLATPFEATGFRLELKSDAGWVSAAGITLKADVGVPCPTGTPAPTPKPSTGVTPPPSTAPTATPTLPPCDPPGSPTPVPSPSATKTPTPATPAPTATPTPAPTATPTKSPTPAPTPTAAPTATPTPAPTATPTKSPTPAPTATPVPTPKPCSHKYTCYSGSRWTSKSAYLKTNWYKMTGGSFSCGTKYKLTWDRDDDCKDFFSYSSSSSILGKLAGSFYNYRYNTTAGKFAANCAALKLNCLRSDNGLNPDGKTSGKLRNVKFVGGECDGKTVGYLLDLCERKVGDDDDDLPSWCTTSKLNELCEDVNEQFDDDNGYTPTGSKFRCDQD